MSGRTDEFIDMSKEWINKYVQIDNAPIKYELFMRASGDQRGDQIVKKELFEKNIKDKYYAVAAIDDRPRVIRMYRAMGLCVFQLNEVDF